MQPYVDQLREVFPAHAGMSLRVITNEGAELSFPRSRGDEPVRVLETDFGQCNIMLDNDVPSDTLLVVSLEECAPVFLEIPGKGSFFAEPLAKTGASDKVQLYGEIGLKYGAEQHHGKLEVTGA